MDVRLLELDVHYVTTVLCHGRGADELHAGCTTEILFHEGLAEIRDWLDATPSR